MKAWIYTMGSVIALIESVKEQPFAWTLIATSVAIVVDLIYKLGVAEGRAGL